MEDILCNNTAFEPLSRDIQYSETDTPFSYYEEYLSNTKKLNKNNIKRCNAELELLNTNTINCNLSAFETPVKFSHFKKRTVSLAKKVLSTNQQNRITKANLPEDFLCKDQLSFQSTIKRSYGNSYTLDTSTPFSKYEETPFEQNKFLNNSKPKRLNMCEFEQINDSSLKIVNIQNCSPIISVLDSKKLNNIFNDEINKSSVNSSPAKENNINTNSIFDCNNVLSGAKLNEINPISVTVSKYNLRKRITNNAAINIPKQRCKKLNVSIPLKTIEVEEVVTKNITLSKNKSEPEPIKLTNNNKRKSKKNSKNIKNLYKEDYLENENELLDVTKYQINYSFYDNKKKRKFNKKEDASPIKKKRKNFKNEEKQLNDISLSSTLYQINEAYKDAKDAKCSNKRQRTPINNTNKKFKPELIEKPSKQTTKCTKLAANKTESTLLLTKMNLRSSTLNNKNAPIIIESEKLCNKIKKSSIKTIPAVSKTQSIEIKENLIALQQIGQKHSALNKFVEILAPKPKINEVNTVSTEKNKLKDKCLKVVGGKNTFKRYKSIQAIISEKAKSSNIQPFSPKTNHLDIFPTMGNQMLLNHLQHNNLLMQSSDSLHHLSHDSTFAIHHLSLNCSSNPSTPSVSLNSFAFTTPKTCLLKEKENFKLRKLNNAEKASKKIKEKPTKTKSKKGKYKVPKENLLSVTSSFEKLNDDEDNDEDEYFSD